MALTPRLELRQSQSLVMTPQLQQAIKLLQLNNIELAAYVEQELERNPLLERDDGLPQSLDDTPADTGGTADEAPPSPDTEHREGDDLTLALSEATPPVETLDTDVDNTWTGDSESDASAHLPGGSGPSLGGNLSSGGSGGGASYGEDEGSLLEQTIAAEVSLRDHLMTQIGVDLSLPAERIIAAYLLELLDESGYLTGDLATAASALECPEEQVIAVLEKLQHFDPPGIFARSLSECLALQLREKNRLDPAMQALLDNLDLLAKRDIAALTRCCAVDHEDIVEMIAEIRALDPRPAQAFDTTVVQPITPDVLMRSLANGSWAIELNNDTLPRVLINNAYYTEVSGLMQTKAERKYLNENLQNASWLVKSLHQRANTILRVATELVRQQEAFFRHGVRHLRPLVLRDIAEAIEMHESTVSRVTTNKYMATPRGIFELKYFFTTAIAGAGGGDAHSSEAVRHRIRDLIEAETPGSVLSDDAIVTLLRRDGIDIARRTVAKYRESLGISSSVQRRRQKRSGI